jgi:tetratricopeptide (TPR) repeat protein
MEYKEFVSRTQQAAQLTKTGRYKEAEVCLYKLFLSNISDIDKINSCAALAVVYDRLGSTEEALTWFDKGIDIEQTYGRYEVAEKKAQYSAQLGRRTAAASIYETLIKQPFVSESEKERMRKTIQILLGQSTQQWK